MECVNQSQLGAQTQLTLVTRVYSGVDAMNSEYSLVKFSGTVVEKIDSDHNTPPP
jgi:hypothetical protein